MEDVTPSLGWGVLHLYYRVDRARAEREPAAAKHIELEAQRSQGADPEDRDGYKAASIFWVSKEARWQHLKADASQLSWGMTTNTWLNFWSNSRGLKLTSLSLEVLVHSFSPHCAAGKSTSAASVVSVGW